MHIMKRVAPDDASPAPKSARLGETPSTSVAATNARLHGRVVLDVGGTRFVSSKSTLESSSSYFESLLARWDEHADEPLFIDADADAVKYLLSYMRLGSLTLPKQDEELCARVLLHAEYLGMDRLLADVKAKAWANMRAGADTRPATVAFDEEVGSLQDAINAQILPARFFGPAPKPPPEPPARTVKTILPTPPGYRALFTDSDIDYGRVLTDDDGDDAATMTLDVLSFVLVELRDGKQVMDAVVQPSIESTRSNDRIRRDEAVACGHMQFASEYCTRQGMNHYLILPPASACAPLLPIPPGSVRGEWVTPALTSADNGKQLTVSGDTITVDGETRAVSWDGEAPQEPISDARISNVKAYRQGFGQVELRLAGPNPCRSYITIPHLKGAGTTLEIDLAFAAVRSSRDNDDETPPSRFFMPMVSENEDGEVVHSLCDARDVTFGDLQFRAFVGARRA
jgi:hypothetical protein